MIYFLFIAGILIELLGMTISVIGVGQLVGMNLIIILLAIAFDIGKIATVSSLQRNWDTMGGVMKTYGIMAVLVTMLITSFGAASYLTTAMQGGVSVVEKIDAQVVALKEENARLIVRKKQIDDQIASIPIDATPRQRNQIIGNFQVEQEQVTNRIAEIANKLPQLEIQKIEEGGKASGIVSLSKNLGVPTETLIKYLVVMIIFVFDPFAIYLIMSANMMLISQQKQTITESNSQAVIVPKIDEVQTDTTSREEIVVSEQELTDRPAPSILEPLDVREDLFASDLRIPSQVINQYSNKAKTPKGIDL